MTSVLTDDDVIVLLEEDMARPCDLKVSRHNGDAPPATHYAFGSCGHTKYLCPTCVQWIGRVLTYGTMWCEMHEPKVKIDVTIVPMSTA
jgi:hypothetical protein